ncbi:MAG: Phosphocarrier protein HPr [Candidatus Izimaplasma bacterium HR2]|nr:MAG: Phosphocarrier protein HPr [Candidatus Izimaplasma bacterium HR2]
MQKEIILKSTVGLHAKIASKLVQLATKYSVDVKLYYNDQVVDAKSILGLMSLAIPSGENIKLVANGEQAEIAIDEIVKLLG